MIPETEKIEYQPRDDESEAKQIAQLSGIGDVQYPDDEEIRTYALDGLGVTLEEQNR